MTEETTSPEENRASDSSDPSTTVRPPTVPAPAGGADPSAAGDAGDCYRYEGDTCIYTDPSSSVEYVYSAAQEGWVRRDGADGGRPVHAPTLENCYYVGEHYCFRDAAGTVYRLDPTTNSWEQWADAPDGDGAAPSAGDERCFRGDDGAWCCRDDSGALCRWDAVAGRWQRADSAVPERRVGRGGRKRRLNRGSSDDSEHDSDEDDGPAPKRTPGEDSGEPEGPSDGSGYEWDAEKGAWFPKVSRSASASSYWAGLGMGGYVALDPQCSRIHKTDGFEGHLA